MKPRDAREKSIAELKTALYDVQKQLGDLYFDLAAGRIKNVKGAATLRREAARIKTILHDANNSS
ncbi:MAG: hypothetical protein G01um101429_116 [Parcubacteria group bacterium Gr01-1014_29]|nr:MAG: hypothetical protein G01um101429_116 [Parcubacteria group bacterium Gr01-1014_29]